jgi:dihydroxy-acid dehydratase
VKVSLREVYLEALMPRTLRSQQWWTGKEYYNFSRRAWLRSEGFTADVFDNRPVIGICN